MMYIMMAVMLVGFYFLMLRPQMKKQKQEKNFQESIKPGTRVVTTSGMHGKIVNVMEDGVIIETMSGKLKFEKLQFPENLLKLVLEIKSTCC